MSAADLTKLDYTFRTGASTTALEGMETPVLHVSARWYRVPEDSGLAVCGRYHPDQIALHPGDATCADCIVTVGALALPVVLSMFERSPKAIPPKMRARLLLALLEDPGMLDFDPVGAFRSEVACERTERASVLLAERYMRMQDAAAKEGR